MSTSQHQEAAPGASPRALLFEAYARAVRGLSTLAFALATALILVDFALIGGAVLTRYFFSSSFLGSDELVAFSLIAIVMLGAPEVLRRNGHIGVDVLVALLSPRAARWAAVWSCISVLLVAALLIVNGWKSVALSRMIGTLTDGHLEWPVWMLQLLMPIGGVLLGLVAIETLWRVLVSPIADQHGEALNQGTSE